MRILRTPSPTAFLICPTLSLLLGQAVAERVEVETAVWITVLGAALGLLLWLFDRRLGLLVLGCVVACGWGFGAYSRLLHPALPLDHVARLPDVSGSVLVAGRLYHEPQLRGNKTQWFLRVDQVQSAGAVHASRGDVLVTVRQAYRDWRYGDHVRMPLRLRVPRNRHSGFNYEAYLARRGIYRIAYLHNDFDVELLRREDVMGWGWIEQMRRHIRRFIYRYLSPPGAPLLAALVLGDRGGLSPELSQSFATVGMSHVLSISGLHVGMLSVWVFFVLRQLFSRSTFLLLRWPTFKVAAMASMLPVLLYTALAGGRIPTVRAAIMIGVYQLAVLFDRDEETFSSLALAALVVALLWPGAMMEVSFQLSFLAVLAIVWGLRVARSITSAPAHSVLSPTWFQKHRNALLLGVLVPILATLGTGPLVVYHFGYLSLSGLVVNPVLVPFVGFVLVPLGLLTGITSLLWAPVAGWLAWWMQPLLSFLVFVVQGVAALPMSAVAVPKPEWWTLIGVYLVLLTLVIFTTTRLRDPRTAGLTDSMVAARFSSMGTKGKGLLSR